MPPVPVATYSPQLPAPVHIATDWVTHRHPNCHLPTLTARSVNCHLLALTALSQLPPTHADCLLSQLPPTHPASCPNCHLPSRLSVPVTTYVHISCPICHLPSVPDCHLLAWIATYPPQLPPVPVAIYLPDCPLSQMPPAHNDCLLSKLHLPTLPPVPTATYLSQLPPNHPDIHIFSCKSQFCSKFLWVIEKKAIKTLYGLLTGLLLHKYTQAQKLNNFLPCIN